MSPVNVMDFLCGAWLGLLCELCVACACWVVEKDVRPSGALRLELGWMRGSKKDGRSREIASVGLYIAAIVNEAAREAQCAGA